MIEIAKAILLGVVEGVTEFLPISSTGHLILVDQVVKLAGSREFVSSFEVVIQLGAILAVVVLYFGELWPFGREGIRKNVLSLWGLVLLGTLPAFALGFLLDDWIDAHFFTPLVVSITLVGYGVILLVVERWGKERFSHGKTLENLNWREALGVGVFQCLALVPGTSRSLATILGGLLLGLSRESAARFSFFLAIPVMVGASGLKLVKHAGGFGTQEMVVLGVGFLVSFVVAWLAIRFLMAYIQKHDFKLFGYYRILLGMIVLIVLGMQ
ncbi:undecaprenyl-diphosphate phosphatase [Thermospira aquatica]|uniref:Undecaprenyl-diphosphatase n=1 Tax=Thermospira aquatica TaxID=2828656 RepID=A0AAX3BG23_9SPIR|nr:undecaprenyl-diphosphate phosphatase [Thermospira aquatica]URA11151.1 undecaprenyl-diphosphate phosphatase [Thermospira aquatica]